VVALGFLYIHEYNRFILSGIENFVLH